MNYGNRYTTACRQFRSNIIMGYAFKLEQDNLVETFVKQSSEISVPDDRVDVASTWNCKALSELL